MKLSHQTIERTSLVLAVGAVLCLLSLLWPSKETVPTELPPSTFTIRAWPNDAKFTIVPPKSEIVPSGEKLAEFSVNMPHPISWIPGNRNFEITISRKGFTSEVFSPKFDKPGKLQGKGAIWPPNSEDRVSLQPKNLLSRLEVLAKQRPLSLGLMILFLALGVPTYLNGRRLLRRGEFLERTQGEVGSDPYLGRTIGDYSVEALLGIGGGGRVYRARTANGSRFALKILPYEDVSPAEIAQARGRFEREMALLKDLRHSNVGQVLDFGSIQNADWILMPLYEDGNLSDRLKSLLPEQQKLSESEILNYAKDIAAGLQAVHDLNICHRDVKPGNVMLHHGRAILIDFGIARGDKDKTMTGIGATIGTALYVPPEQIDRSRVTAQADQYSYGLILCQMLTGKLPYRSDSDNELGLLAEKMLSSHVPVRELDPELSEDMENFFSRILDKEPSSRFPTVSEAFQAFEAALRSTD